MSHQEELKGCCGAILISALLLAASASAQSTNAMAHHAQEIDLAAALRLAGAQNLDIQIAKSKLTEAEATERQATEQFFPWIAPGFSYRRHEGRIQDVGGNMFDVDKQSYTVGANITAQLDIGDALYKSLEAKQLSKAATHAVESQRLETVALAAQNYFELARTEALIGIAEEAVRISQNYEQQLRHAVNAGLAFKGDQLRIAVQTEKFRLELEQAQEQKKLASARLAEVLNLKLTDELTAVDAEIVPLRLANGETPLNELVAKAFTLRPEIKQSHALVAASRENQKAATVGPLIPIVGAQAFAGGLGGGRDTATGNFSDSADFFASLSWRVGPGGLLDSARIDASKSRLKTTELAAEKVQQFIERQVVDAAIQVRSLQQQITTAQNVLKTAQENLKLTGQRKEFAVGVVLENIQAQQDLTKARADYISAIADFNKAQYALLRAVGSMNEVVK